MIPILNSTGPRKVVVAIFASAVLLFLCIISVSPKGYGRSRPEEVDQPQSIKNYAPPSSSSSSFFDFGQNEEKSQSSFWRGGSNRDKTTDIYNQTLGFEKLLVIGLPDRYDKQDVWAMANLATDVKSEWVAGVRGEDMNPKAVPAGWKEGWTAGELGCFRGHLNAVQKMIDERLSSALIFEDDADWDVMIKSQLVQFAHGARFVQDINDTSSMHSPYGDDWDLLWLGHCGAENNPRGPSRFWVAADDPTVTPYERSRWAGKEPARVPNLSAAELSGKFTRVVYWAHNFRCATAYALSLRGAKKFLNRLSIEPYGQPADRAISGFCGLSNVKCIAPWPTFIDQYRPAGSSLKSSDRVKLDQGKQRTHGETDAVVFPVKSGIESFVKDLDVWKSQWPDVTMWPEIRPGIDELPAGYGVILSGDDFPTYNSTP